MNKLNFILLSVFLCVILSACDSGPAPVEITDLKNYTDSTLKFAVDYPSNWVTSSTPGARFMVFSSNDAKSRFVDFKTTGFPGAMIDLNAMKVDETQTIDSILAKVKQKFDIDYKTSDITVDGFDGKKLEYGFELNDGNFKGVFVVASKDNVTYTTLKIEAFADSWDKYDDNFSKVISSLKLAQTQVRGTDTQTVIIEQPFPSDTLTTEKGTGFAISIPKNFYRGKAASSGVIASYNYIGDRRGDCNIQIDVLDGSQNKDFKKAATELAAKYPGNPALSNASVGGGESAYMINYKATKDVKSRVYFVKKGDKFYRMTVNWFVPEESNYLPIFEKCIASFKLD
ncbi:MAG: hypothetical protein LBO69_07910 [Ignavibacteria bacterium]|jgi:hypothetical protein|nr:hypothetical protein [Ignavibacteria bacterium]